MFDVVLALAIGTWFGFTTGAIFGIEVAYKREKLIKGEK